MGFRFRRSFKIAPGLRLNTSLGGISMSAGVRGAGITIGRRGLSSHAGIPGTGLSFVSGGGGRKRSAADPAAGLPNDLLVSVRVLLDDDGTVRLEGPIGPLTPAQVKQVRAQQGEAIAHILDMACERWNQGIDELLTVHHATPAPEPAQRFQATAFLEDRPVEPVPRGPGPAGTLLSSTA